MRLEGTILTVGAGAGFWKRTFVASLTKKYKRETDLSLTAKCFCVGCDAQSVEAILLSGGEPEDMLKCLICCWVSRVAQQVVTINQVLGFG